MGSYSMNSSRPIGYSSAPMIKVPAHRKRKLGTGAIAMASVLAGALATTGVIFALQPGAFEPSAGNAFGTASQAVAAVAEPDVPAESEKIVVAAEGPYLPVPILSTGASAKAKANEPEKAAAENAVVENVPAEEAPTVDVGLDTQTFVAVEPEDTHQAVWHEGWTETVTTPAVTEHIPGYDSYICSECGYESLDSSDISSHLSEHAEATYLTVENEPIDFVVEKEKTETIHHEGYWE